MAIVISRKYSVCFLATVCITLVCLACSSAIGQQQKQNEATNAPRVQTLAVVNGSSISRQEVANECMRRFGNEVLESLVNKMLVFEECQRQGIAITEGDVNNELTSQAQKLGLSTERYVGVLCEKKKISIDKLKRDVVWSELALRRLAESQTQVSDAEINDRIEFEFGAKVQVRQLVVNSQEEAQKFLAAATADPASFERICKDYSLDRRSAAMGGLLPPIRRRGGFPQFEDVAFALQPGQFSQPFSVEDQFVVLKCVRQIEAVQIDEAGLAAAREQIKAELSREKLRGAAEKLFLEMQANAEIVNVMNDENLRRQNPGVAAMVNGKPIAQKMVAEECIVTFGESMLAVLIRGRLLEQSLQQAGMTMSEERQSQLIDQEIARVAEARGFFANGQPMIEDYLKHISDNDPAKVEFYIEDVVWPTIAMQELVKDRVEVTEEDMQKSFEANYGPRVEVRAIMFNNQRDATKVWKMATDNPKEDFFGKLANQYSIEPMSKNNFGLIPPIQKYSGRPTLEAEAFSLRPGEISKVVHLGDYWTFMYCRGRTTPKVDNIEDVREYIYKDVLARKSHVEMEIARQRMFKEAQIDNFLTGTSQPGAAAVKSVRVNDGRTN